MKTLKNSEVGSATKAQEDERTKIFRRMIKNMGGTFSEQREDNRSGIFLRQCLAMVCSALALWMSY